MPLLDLIAAPFGPFSDSSLLSEDFPKLIRAPNKLQLRNVYMESRGKFTGLDYTEYVATPPKKTSPVKFYGILRIEDLQWLSPEGLELLQDALRERDKQLHRNLKESRLTLQSLYGTMPGTGSKISVWIYCRKNLQASFLTKEGHYQGEVILQSFFGKPKPRPLFWCIRSFYIKTVSLSRNYLEHWRFYDFVKQLHLKDPSFPLKERTPRHIMLALKHRFRVDAKHHRDEFDAEIDSDVDEEGNTKIPRFPRHVSSAEIYGAMASHAEWFLAQQLASTHSSHTYVNLKEWHKFCLKVKEVKSTKRRLQRAKRPWRTWIWSDLYIPPSKKRGRPATQTGTIDLSPFGAVPGGWDARIQKRCIDYEFPEFGDEGYLNEEVEDHAVHGRPIYDRDMPSEDSSPPPDSSSDDSDYNVPWINKIPLWLMQDPVMRPGQVRWTCPDQKCRYHLDLLEMRRSTKFSDPEYDFLRNDSLNVGDIPVQELLLGIIEEHYHEHYMRLGFNVVKSTTGNMKPKVRVVRWEPDRESENDHSDEDLKVKEEYMDL
ncbi:hypothetical protein EV361DRAFT_948591 [Lentinula raphanica]|uniref:Uncharacterized protein n=1 Tax=Lentinula raphanica TaxID=153919 RepID=A0AA38PC29_9AGAR|nr:hypothetical protein F5878DRAFT_659910 [Lentinula raphanica]KAJ3972681.1 hypothetical protein EV361DRAFT_948591 [Lentinula raphanica]